MMYSMKKTSDGLSLQLVLNNKFTTPFFYYKITPNYRSYFMSTKHFRTFMKVFCTLQVEGIHNWPECPIEEVSYLKVPHRHVFYIKAKIDVDHSDRMVEFIQLKHQIGAYVKQKWWCEKINMMNFGRLSCEDIGTHIMKEFNLSEVEVSEDDENGCLIINTSYD